MKKQTRIKPVQQTYKGKFFKDRHTLSWRAPIVGQALIDTFHLKAFKPSSSVIDIGCAIGDYVLWLQEKGFRAFGMEGSEAAQEYMVTDSCIIWDLRIDFTSENANFLHKYDLAFSLEVAEHIEPEFADNYVRNLCCLSDTILISAACPGQKGHGHVNCQPAEYWVDRFNRQGYRYSQHSVNLWRKNLQPNQRRKELSSYYNNALVFKRGLTN